LALVSGHLGPASGELDPRQPGVDLIRVSYLPSNHVLNPATLNSCVPVLAIVSRPLGPASRELDPSQPGVDLIRVSYLPSNHILNPAFLTSWEPVLAIVSRPLGPASRELDPRQPGVDLIRVSYLPSKHVVPHYSNELTAGHRLWQDISQHTARNPPNVFRRGDKDVANQTPSESESP
jgi:hypothetical protein